MKKTLLIVLFVLSGCDYLNPKDDVQLQPGTYRIHFYDEEYFCSDGAHNADVFSTETEWEIVQDTENNWLLYLDEFFYIYCYPRQNGIECVYHTVATIPGVCTYPLTMTVNIQPEKKQIIGYTEVVYDLVTCTNGNTGSCTFSNQFFGVLLY
jgi:hypothetical protein